MLLTLLQATAQASNTASRINVEQLLDRLLNWGIEVGKDILAAIIIYIVGRFIIKQISLELVVWWCIRKCVISVWGGN